jgi:hypothetical protein
MKDYLNKNKDCIVYHLPVCRSGIGDIFMELVTFLHTHSLFSYRNKTMKLMMYYDYFTPNIGCDTMDELLDFYCLEKPDFKYTSSKLRINEMSPDAVQVYLQKNFEIENLDKIRTRLFDKGFIWPSTIKKETVKTDISFMFYNHKFFSDGQKEITDFDELKFIEFMNKNDNINFIPLYQYVNDRRSTINPIRLNPLTVMKENLQIISNSSMVIGSEGLWTHMSRYLETHTIMHTTNVDWEREALQQNHKSFRKMDDLLYYLKGKINEICS